MVNKKKTYQSIASSRPSPFVADVLNIDQVRVFNTESPKAFETSAAVIAPSISLWEKKKMNVWDEDQKKTKSCQTEMLMHIIKNNISRLSNNKRIGLTCLLANTQSIASFNSSS